MTNKSEIVASPKSLRRLLVLFVHGLRGQSSSTWGGFASLIEQDKQLNEIVDISYFDFPTHFFPIPVLRGRLLRIQDLSRSLDTEISYRYEKYDRIILVCHSMGGLVAQRYYIERVKRGASSSVTNILMYGTPNQGSWLANWLARLPFLNNQVRQLQPGGDILNLIEQDWDVLDCKKRVDLKYIIGGQDAIVNIDSASRRSVVNTHLISDKGHIDLVKPNSSSDLSFLILKKSILDRADNTASVELEAERNDFKPEMSSSANLSVLFEAYRPLYESYYVQREEDDIVNEVMSTRSVWVWGPSGYGKTASLMRALHLQKAKFCVISLGHFAGADAFGLFKGLYLELINLCETEAYAASDWPELLSSSKRAIIHLSSCGYKKILIEEIPVMTAGEQNVFMDKLKLLFVSTSNSAGEDKISYVLSSILNPCEFFTGNEKISELVMIYPFGQWQASDSEKLIAVIVLNLGLDLSEQSGKIVAKRLNYSPRRIKMFFLDCVATNVRSEQAIAAKIDEHSVYGVEK